MCKKMSLLQGLQQTGSDEKAFVYFARFQNHTVNWCEQRIKEALHNTSK